MNLLPFYSHMSD